MPLLLLAVDGEYGQIVAHFAGNKAAQRMANWQSVFDCGQPPPPPPLADGPWQTYSIKWYNYGHKGENGQTADITE